MQKCLSWATAVSSQSRNVQYMLSMGIALSTEMCIASMSPAPLWSSSAVVIADELNLRLAHA